MRVLLDATVLWSMVQTDWLMTLAEKNVIKPYWTDNINKEWMRTLSKKRPELSQQQLEWRLQCMCNTIPDWRIEGFEHRILSLQLKDEDDRHVLAAAIEGGIPWIVTDNLDDFPANSLVPYGIQAISPDELIANLMNTSREMASEVHSIALQLQTRLRNPPVDWPNYLNKLSEANFRRTSKLLYLTNQGLWS